MEFLGTSKRNQQTHTAVSQTASDGQYSKHTDAGTAHSAVCFNLLKRMFMKLFIKKKCKSRLLSSLNQGCWAIPTCVKNRSTAARKKGRNHYRL